MEEQKQSTSSNYFKGLSRRDYIQKAHEIIQQEGIQAVSIRRIAKEMGCSSASLYRYFDNVSELLYYAELRILTGYIDRLNEAEKSWKNMWQVYVGVWDCYATEAFHNPEAYNLLFFEYNNVKLKEAMREYYEMFPEDIVNVNRFFYNMLQTPSFLARDFEMCKRCINVGGITYDNAVKLNRMVCMLFEGYFKDVYENGIEEEQIPERIKVYTVKSPEKDKLEVLSKLLCYLGDKSSLVFVNYRESVERVYRYLLQAGISCEMFHGGMEQKDRERALYKFSNGSCNVFVSTDLAARGLDIPNIDHVIHYHLPLNEDAYIHRNGRTARWDASGNVFLILGPEEYLPEFIQQIPEDYVWEGPKPDPAKPQWVTLYIGKGKKDKINKVDIVGFLSKVGGLGKSDIGRIDVKEHYAFVAIRRNLLKETLAAVSGQKIKGIKTIIEKTK